MTGGHRLEPQEKIRNRCELLRSLARLAEPPGSDCKRLAEILELGASPKASEHTELFVHQLYPYASIYLGTEGQLGGEARDRIAGLWRILGQSSPTEPDHLTILLALYAHLIELEANEPNASKRGGLNQVRAVLLWEHLLSWLPAYLHKLSQLAPQPYHRWSVLLCETLSEEARLLPPPPVLPSHLHEVPQLSDPREVDLKYFLSSLLTPVRSGLILTRADLSRAAQDLQLGLRLGERHFILKTLIGQNAADMLTWLTNEAITWTTTHKNWWCSGSSNRFWEKRAQSAVSLLDELCKEATKFSPHLHS